MSSTPSSARTGFVLTVDETPGRSIQLVPARLEELPADEYAHHKPEPAGERALEKQLSDGRVGDEYPAAVVGDLRDKQRSASHEEIAWANLAGDTTRPWLHRNVLAAGQPPPGVRTIFARGCSAAQGSPRPRLVTSRPAHICRIFWSPPSQPSFSRVCSWC